VFDGAPHFLAFRRALCGQITCVTSVSAAHRDFAPRGRAAAPV